MLRIAAAQWPVQSTPQIESNEFILGKTWGWDGLGLSFLEDDLEPLHVGEQAVSSFNWTFLRVEPRHPLMSKPFCLDAEAQERRKQDPKISRKT